MKLRRRVADLRLQGAVGAFADSRGSLIAQRLKPPNEAG